MISRLGFKATKLSALLLGTAGGQAFFIAVSPILARLYEPEAMAAFGVCAGLIGVLGSAGCARTEQIILLVSDARIRRCVVRIGVTAALLASALVTILATCLLPTQPLSLHAIIGAAFAFFTVGQLRQGQLLAFGDLRAVGRVGLVQSIVASALQIAFGTFDAGSTGLIGGYACGLLTAAAVARPSDPTRTAALDNSNQKGVRCRSVLRHYARFCIMGSASAMLSGAGQIYLLLLIGPTLLTGYELGQLYLAARVAGLPVVVVGNAVAQLYVSEASAALRRFDRVQPIFRVFVVRVALLSVAIAPATLSLPWGFSFVFGSEWTLAGELSRVLFLQSLIQLVVRPVGQSLALLEHHRTVLVWEVIRLFGVVAILVGVELVSADVHDVVLCYGVWQGVCYLAFLVLTAHAVRRHGSGSVATLPRHVA